MMRKYAVMLSLQLATMAILKWLDLLYYVVSNVTFQRMLLYAMRYSIDCVLTITQIAIRTTNSNPMMKVVEKEIEKIPKESFMAAKTAREPGELRALIRDFTTEGKIAGMSCACVLLTKVIQISTCVRRYLVGQIADNRKRETTAKSK